jgi:hypothetical protein
MAGGISIPSVSGLTREQIDNAGSYSTSSLFSDEDKLVLRYAEELTQKAQVEMSFIARCKSALVRKRSSN